jgi:hypothetical protein
MNRRLFSFFVVALILTACGNTGNGKLTSKTDPDNGSIKVEFASLIENPGDYVGKTISVEGKVVHVCTMSGKKLFITGENPDVRLYVQAGEEMPKFPMELLGSEIIVEGKITKVASVSEDMGEGMHSGDGEMMAAGADTCETSKAMASQPALSDLMMIYNKHTLVK